jgi:hypothetical protein
MINHSNPFVSYLNRYTTVSPEHEAAFDEFISQASAPFGKQLRLETNIEKFLNKCFKLAHPPSIILTGNAGDGKTYLCRQIIKLFTGNEVTEWNDQVEWPLEKDDLELIVIKDLSEVGEASGARAIAVILYKLYLTDRPVRGSVCH